MDRNDNYLSTSLKNAPDLFGASFKELIIIIINKVIMIIMRLLIDY